MTYAFYPGRVIEAAPYVEAFQLLEKHSTGDLAIVPPGTAADVPGSSLTFTTVNDDAEVLIRAVYDLRFTANTGQEANRALGHINVDGTDLAQFAIMRTVSNKRETLTQVGRAVLATAGSHTIKLRGSSNHTVGTATIANPHTGWRAYLVDLPKV